MKVFKQPIPQHIYEKQIAEKVIFSEINPGGIFTGFLPIITLSAID